MNTEHKEKVKRWKIAIQHYDFDVQHVKGKYNVEADALSRLVPIPTKDNEINTLIQTDTIKKTSSIDPKIYENIKRAHGTFHSAEASWSTSNIFSLYVVMVYFITHL